MRVITYTDDDMSENTASQLRTRSEAGRVLSALARNMDHDNGLRAIFHSVAVMADNELWGIEDCLNTMRTNWSKSLEKSQATRDQLAADVATLQNERDKLLRELADTQEAYRKYREGHEKVSTVQDAFTKAGLANHPGYEGFYYHNDPGVSDFAWLRYDGNDAKDGLTGIFVFDQYEWVPIEQCPGYSEEDIELLHGQVPNGIPQNDMPLSGFVLDKLPGIVQDIWVGRFASIGHARAEDIE